MVSRSGGDSRGEFLWEIRELYPRDDGSLGWTESSIAPSGGSFDELIRDLEHMLTDAGLEILDLVPDPARLVHLSELRRDGATRSVEPAGSHVPDVHDDTGTEDCARHSRWTAHLDRQVPGEVERLLGTVPEWFGQPDSNAGYVEAARTKETWTVRDASGEVVGVTLVDRHFPHVAEIHLIAVDRAAHGTGVGTAMLAAIETDAIARGVRLLEVKTLGASHPDPGYARTRHFYEKRGFLPLEETSLWGEDSPCLIMVKPLLAR